MSEETAFEVGRLYVPLKSIADTLVASQKDVFVRLPALVGYWPMGIRDNAGNVSDHAGGGGFFAETGVCPTGYDGDSFTHIGNGTNYLSASAAFGITGLETWVDSSIRGLTVGGWFMVDAGSGTARGIISKDGVSPQRGYGLTVDATNSVSFFMSGNGAAIFGVAGPAFPLLEWTFLVGRFIPSTEVAIFTNGDKATSTTAIPASQFVSSQALEIGRFLANNTRIVHGKARDVFICASALSDALIEEVRVTSVP